jgi:hypothetical protein
VWLTADNTFIYEAKTVTADWDCKGRKINYRAFRLEFRCKDCISTMSEITDSNILSAIIKFDGKYLLSYLPSYDADAKWKALSINCNLNFFEISALQAYVKDVRDKIMISNISPATSSIALHPNNGAIILSSTETEVKELVKESPSSIFTNKWSRATNNVDLTNMNNINHTTLFYEIILNDDIFQQIKELLNNTLIGTNTLLNVSMDFHVLKEANFHFKLNRQYSFTYYSSLSYRERITCL